jgi:crossover junction endodeoxyribonuclease RusA
VTEPLPHLLRFTVYGTPAPQGSKRHVGGGRMIEASTRLAPWREAVAWSARRALPKGWQPLDEPVLVVADFRSPRPASARHLVWNARRPDLDKLLRAICDSLVPIVLVDDARIVGLVAHKRYATADRPPGVAVTLIRPDQP